MGLFRRADSGRGEYTHIDGLTEAAISWGWEAVEKDTFDVRLVDRMHRVARVLHGAFPRPMASGSSVVNPTTLIDVYRGTVDGRSVTVGNVWVAVESVNVAGQRLYGQGFCAVELTTLLVLVGIEPRSKHQAFEGVEIPTGDVAFDAAFRAVGLNASAAEVLTPELRQRVLAYGDWAFLAHQTTFVSIASTPFSTAEEVSRRAGEVLGVVNAIPTSIAPAQADHSLDDLLARIDGLHSIEEATAFLEQLPDTDRQRLAASPTPLARFADVRTRDDIVTRFLSLPESDRRQILAMFDKATGA